MATESKLFHSQGNSATDWMWYQKNASMRATLEEEFTKKHKTQLNRRAENVKKFNKDVVDLEKKIRSEGDENEKKRLQKQLKDTKESKKKAEKELEKAKADIRKEANRVAEIAEKNRYAAMNKREKMEYQKTVLENLKADKKALKEKHQTELAEITLLKKKREKAKTPEEAAKLDKQIKAKTKQASKTEAKISSLSADETKVNNVVQSLFEGIATASEKAKKAAEDYVKAEQHRSEVAAEESANQEALQKKLKEATTKEEKDEIKKKIKASKDNVKRAEEEARAAFDAKTAAEKRAQKDKEHEKKLEERQKKRDDAEKKRQELLDSFDPSKSRKQIDDNLNAIYGDQAKYLARLEGSNEKWRKSVDNVSDAIGFSGIVSKKNVIGKMKELVDSGIAYNIEMRAFLAETSANIASTFEATNGTLLRMIRLQQQDSTAARLGMEATLTRLFNQFFEDTSYLNDVADNISSSILDASATLSRDMSLEFEYTMQKWLGSLYSLGMSSEAVQSIATGINYLGTGNVSALNGNSTLQTLLAMSASRSGGKSYAQLLTEGIDANETNKLLRAMIEYLAEIARSQGNMVTKSAYAELFGMSVTDLSAFASLTTSEIESLYKNTVSYKDLMDETETRLSQISKNMSLSDLVDTAIENAQVGVATTIGSSAFTYGTWKALGLLQDYVGEIPIPGILAAGFGISSDIDLLNVAQTAMAGMGLLGSLLGGLGSMFNGGVTNLNNWDFNESTSRGGSLVLLNQGSTTNTSYSATLGVGGATGDTVSDVSMESAKSTAMDEGGVTSEEMEEGKEIPAKIYDALAGDEEVTVLSLLQELRDYNEQINERLDYGRVFYTAIAGVMSSDAVGALTDLQAQMDARGYVAAAKSTEEDSKEDTTIPKVDTGISSEESGTAGLSQVAPTDLGMSLIIKEAVEEALKSFAFANNTLPVTISNPFTLPTI